MNIFQSWKKLSFFSKKKFLSKELFQKKFCTKNLEGIIFEKKISENFYEK